MTLDELDGEGPDRYLAADGTLTADGDDAGRWLDAEHARGADWDTLADTLEVHPRVARHLHTLWCTARDRAADEAQHALF
ncbi:hypothetical protein HQ325_03060 [Rhodococcus sp. BP-349]|uniref:hypothetical protein n=1 Tax=unclassified Rhodococcus (in: high G+C Gram-positive bacteria) TaxID=192944 RepID=UPI001C9ABCC1|nr:MULTISPECIES: hypothetical protein [unclassified Rhodococcus (in: high G+C Gram-positive bacteria)]MBY6537643.1 hypothetical protein [Rhodococcus sp. BP-363]MBY6541980.1 hypothetical protein [Rhodococcus sp. BP-369]MBY6561210.1 hypothetical protein [Rhodococcus sp. BP-370]MBY6575502.1 hypothetical protein [Rhodococcus sp. BP-364]MBY6584803.1 hypothetical protein [Rhodococcus sp. BP-358]